MKLFELKGWELTVSEEAWGLLPFKNILERDKGKDKEQALKEVLFIYFFCDIRSNYMHIPAIDRTNEIKKDIGLKEDWEIDEVIQEGIDLYLKEKSIIETLYSQSIISVQAIGEYLAKAKELLEERDINGRPVFDISKITIANEKIPKLMANLKLAYREVVKEREDNANKKKGSKSFNIFEDGFQ